MASPPAERRVKTDLLALVRAVPVGRVVSHDTIAAELGVLPMVIVKLLSNLTDDERQAAQWHRVVAKGGAIGRGPHRDAQFARLVREGVPVSPAGIVQDMARVAVSDAGALKGKGGPIIERSVDRDPPAPPGPPQSRSRGMKDRPG